MADLAIGIIGYGRIGAEHARWISSASGVRAAGAADPTAARLDRAAAQGLKAYPNLDALLDDGAIDAVLIATPTAMHFEQAMLALEAGKHIMVEKPMALDLNESRRLATEAEARGKVLSVFHNRRWDVDFLTVQAAVRSNLLGKLINVETRLGQFASCVGPAAPEYRPGWRNEAGYGGGALFDWGSHFVDQLWRLLWPARPVRVFAQLRGNVWSRDCDDFARVLIDFDNGAVGLCEINTTTARPLPRWHLDGSAGSASSAADANFDTARWAKLQFTPSDSDHPVGPIPALERGLSERQIWEQFAAACRGQGAPAVEPRTVLPTMALLDAARQSSLHQESCDVSGVVEWVY